jgi:hypothetical protein
MRPGARLLTRDMTGTIVRVMLLTGVGGLAALQDEAVFFKPRKRHDSS